MPSEERGIIADSGPGPVRTVIEAHGAALRLFDRHRQNAIIRDMLHDIGEFFISVFLEKRFSDYVKRTGYSTGRGWQSIKDHLKARGVISGNEPFVYTGVMRFNALHDAHPEARATASRAYVLIRIPIGHPLRQRLSEIFKKIPPWEMTRMAQVGEESLIKHLNGALQERMVRPNPPSPKPTPTTRRQQRERSHVPKKRIGAGA